MAYFTVYATDGAILRSGTCPDADTPKQVRRTSERLHVGAAGDPVTQYVVSTVPGVTEVRNRPTIAATLDTTSVPADGTTPATLSGLPAGSCTVTVDGVAYEVTDGSLEITFDTPGEYVLQCSVWPYLDRDYTVTAT